MSTHRRSPSRPATEPTPTNDCPLTREEQELLAAALPASRLAEPVPEHVDVMARIDAAMLKENLPEPESSPTTRVREVLGL